jgi:hypothetical protein
MVAAEVDPKQLVLVDEMGVHTSLASLYGYSRKGERVHLQVPRNRGKNTTLLASITLSGMGETMAVEGSTDREVFDAYVEHVLAPTLEAGHVVIMDNLSAHKPAKVRELIESRSCELERLFDLRTAEELRVLHALAVEREHRREVPALGLQPR